MVTQFAFALGPEEYFGGLLQAEYRSAFDFNAVVRAMQSKIWKAQAVVALTFATAVAAQSIKSSVISNIDLSKPFSTREAWRFIATQGPPVAGDDTASGGEEPGQIQLCLRTAPSARCDPQLLNGLRAASYTDDFFTQPNYVTRTTDSPKTRFCATEATALRFFCRAEMFDFPLQRADGALQLRQAAIDAGRAQPELVVEGGRTGIHRSGRHIVRDSALSREHRAIADVKMSCGGGLSGHDATIADD